MKLIDYRKFCSLLFAVLLIINITESANATSLLVLNSKDKLLSIGRYTCLVRKNRPVAVGTVVRKRLSGKIRKLLIAPKRKALIKKLTTQCVALLFIKPTATPGVAAQTPSPTQTNMPTIQPTLIASATPTSASQRTQTPTPVPTQQRTPSPTITAIITIQSTPTTGVATNTPTQTPVATATSTFTATATSSPTGTVIATATPTQTATPTITPTATSTHTPATPYPYGSSGRFVNRCEMSGSLLPQSVTSQGFLSIPLFNGRTAYQGGLVELLQSSSNSSSLQNYRAAIYKFPGAITDNLTFGNNGLVTFSLPQAADPTREALVRDWSNANGAYDGATAVLPDGRLVIGGTVTGTIPGSSPYNIGYVAMITPQGALDGSFGHNGVVTFEQFEFISISEIVFRLYRDGQRSLLVGGIAPFYQSGNVRYYKPAMISLNLDGTIEQGLFGNNPGIITDNCSPVLSHADNGIAGTGKLWGDRLVDINRRHSCFRNSVNDEMYITAYKLVGGIDNTFGDHGVFRINIRGLNWETIDSGEILPTIDGKLLVALNVSRPDGSGGRQRDLILFKLTIAGDFDLSFGIHSPYTDIFRPDTAYAEFIEEQSDGNIVIGMRTANATSCDVATVVRLTINGQYDTSYAMGGVEDISRDIILTDSARQIVQCGGRRFVDQQNRLHLAHGWPEISGDRYRFGCELAD